MNEEETREGHLFFLVCLARLAEGEATSFPSTCFRERWENRERTEISVTVTKGVACEGGYASTCLVDFLYNFLYFSFWEEGMMLQLKQCVSKAKLSFVCVMDIQRFYGCKLRGTFFF